MLHSQIVLNTLVYDRAKKVGIDQLAMLQAAVRLGIENVEIRREYFIDMAIEIPLIANYAAQNNVRLFYSVPAEIFVAGKVNPDLATFIDEGQTLGIYAIKFNIGDFQAFNGDLAHALNPYLSNDIQVNIENDQTTTSGTLTPIKNFLNAAQTAGVKIGYVYDLGNWRVVGEDELLAAKTLAPFCQYIHIKNTTTVTGQVKVTNCLTDGDINWQAALALLPTDKPVAIEYPVDSLDELMTTVTALEAFGG